MAGLDGKDPFALRFFRHTGDVTGASPSGEKLFGKGVVSAFQRGKGEYGGERHALGSLDRPLYRFIGWLPGWESLSGGTLSQGDAVYRVLEIVPVALGGRLICYRAVLERMEKGEANGDQ